MFKLYSCLILLIFGLSSPALSIDWILSSESGFADSKSNFVSLFDRFPTETFQGVPHKGQEVTIEYKALVNPAATASVVILHGYSENFIKYQELIYDFFNNGYSVYMYNHRGHGNSRLLENKSIFVEDFNHYVEDLNIFVSSIVKKQGKPLFLFAHSLGGGVTARFMETHPNLVDGAVLSSPMIGMITKPYPKWMAEGIASFGSLIGMEESLAPGQSLPQNNWTFETSNSSSLVRYEHYRDNTYSKKFEDMRRGGATYGFVRQNFIGTEILNRPEEISKISKPILLFQAEFDTWVSNEAQTNFCSQTDLCTLIPVKGAKHEIYNEADSFRIPLLTKALNFYQAQSNRINIGLRSTAPASN